MRQYNFWASARWRYDSATSFSWGHVLQACYLLFFSMLHAPAVFRHDTGTSQASCESGREKTAREALQDEHAKQWSA